MGGFIGPNCSSLVRKMLSSGYVFNNLLLVRSVCSSTLLSNVSQAIGCQQHVRQQLTQSLEQLRERIAKKEEKAPKTILNDKDIEKIVETLPHSTSQLRKIKGIGNQKVGLVGKDVINIILDLENQSAIDSQPQNGSSHQQLKPMQTSIKFNEKDSKRQAPDRVHEDEQIQQNAQTKAGLSPDISGQIQQQQESATPLSVNLEYKDNTRHRQSSTLDSDVYVKNVGNDENITAPKQTHGKTQKESNSNAQKQLEEQIQKEQFQTQKLDKFVQKQAVNVKDSQNKVQENVQDSQKKVQDRQFQAQQDKRFDQALDKQEAYQSPKIEFQDSNSVYEKSKKECAKKQGLLGSVWNSLSGFMQRLQK
eukprot:TRINITY_DN3099_c0_g1_i1.p1 TRINITY_DN3099_c0_g1~~TRINITY_DN3099_c0_g1_i1.p1  ORF type:complete len:363 (-),score=27.76 TRINITY_DN3099_c0_g1_i1:186-1274(-)